MAEHRGWISTNDGLGGTAAIPGTDEGRPQVSRMYDYYLGGRHHFAADRKAADEMLRVAPGAVVFARASRRFLQVAVEHLVREEGVAQLLDLGTGIPTEPSTHQLAQHHRREARVLYVDNDPAVLPYARALLTSTPEGRVDYVEADVRHPEQLREHPCLAGLEPVLDLRRPVGVVASALLHFLGDEERPGELLRRLLAPLAPGSFLVLSHVTSDFVPDVMERVSDMYRSRHLPTIPRSRARIEELVADSGAELVAPGIQPVNRWWPERPATLAPIPLCTDAEASAYGLLARKP